MEPEFEFNDFDYEETCGPIKSEISQTCNCKKKKNKPCNCKCEKNNYPNKEEILDKPKGNEKKLCSKCQLNKASIKFRNDSTCKECFLQAQEHKFKYTLRTLLSLKKNEQLLLAFSGGTNSMAMLKLAGEALFNSGAKKLFFSVKVIYIDECSIYGLPIEKSIENKEKIKSICEKIGLDLKIFDIQDAFLLENMEETLKILPVLKEKELNKDPLKCLKNLFSNLSETGFSREFISFTLKKLLIFSYAKQIKIQKVLFGDSGQTVACKILSEVVQGRAIDMENQIKYMDNQFESEGIIICRPLRDFLKKEILLYNHIQKIDDLVLEMPKLVDFMEKGKNLPGKGNFNILIEDLLDRLQDGNNSTIHTVLNTCEKVKAKEKSDSYCGICHNKSDNIVNLLEIGGFDDNWKHFKEETFIDKLNDNNKIDGLCFGCKRIKENTKDSHNFINVLPEFIQKKLKNNLQN